MEEERRSGMSEVLHGLKRIEERLDKHSGEGQGTTHGLIEKRLNAHGTSITRLKTISGFISVAWIATVGAISRKFWS